MGQTMVEQLFARKQGAPVAAGDIVTAALDGAMCDYKFGAVNVLAMKAGFAGGVPKVWDPERVFVLGDHHQPAPSQKLADNNQAVRRHVERLGIRTFLDAQPGISHQMMIDGRLAHPGDLIVANDSHAIAYGAVNAAGTGISSTEMVYALMFGELWFKVPETIRIVLTGRVPDYPIAKDIILHLAGLYGDDFANDQALEFAGTALAGLGLDGRLCLAAHGVEVGAKFALFPFDDIARQAADPASGHAPLGADPDARYVREIEIDLDTLPIVVARPHGFGNVVPVAEVDGTRLDQAQIGSCANGRLEDIEIAARVMKGRHVAPGVRFIISPASQQVYRQALRAGYIETLVEAGCQVVTPGCGICQPMVGYLSDGEVCITSTTRNYRGRKGSPEAEIYLAGPLTVAAAAIAGHIVDPREVLDDL